MRATSLLVALLAGLSLASCTDYPRKSMTLEYLYSWGKDFRKPGALNQPMGVGIGPDSLVYVGEPGAIHVFSLEGEFVRTITFESEYKAAFSVGFLENGTMLIETAGHIFQNMELDGSIIEEWDASYGVPDDVPKEAMCHAI